MSWLVQHAGGAIVGGAIGAAIVILPSIFILYVLIRRAGEIAPSADEDDGG